MNPRAGSNESMVGLLFAEGMLFSLSLRISIVPSQSRNTSSLKRNSAVPMTFPIARHLLGSIQRRDQCLGHLLHRTSTIDQGRRSLSPAEPKTVTAENKLKAQLEEWTEQWVFEVNVDPLL